MSWPTSPTNGQIHTLADGTQFSYRSATLSWVKVPPGGAPPQVAIYDGTAGTPTSISIPAGAKFAEIIACGGGASGQATFANSTDGGAGGAGGGSGCSACLFVNLADVVSMEVTLGAGGDGTITTIESGDDTVLTIEYDTNTYDYTFGGGQALFSAILNVGVVGALGSGGRGGSFSSDDPNVDDILLWETSNNGDRGSRGGQASSTMASGNGGSSFFGRGGYSVLAAATGSEHGIAGGFGAGGSGGSSKGAGSTRGSAGDGGQGKLTVKFFF